MKPAAPLVLAIDIGTSSLRTALFDQHARRLVATTAQEKYRLRVTPDGGAELSPQVLRAAFLRCLSKTLHHSNTPPLRSSPILAVGTSCFWHSLVGTDANGRALTPIYTWADSRCREDAARLRASMSERYVHARTGCMLRTSFWPAKLAWLRRTQPRTFARVTRWMSPAEWLQRQFCGEAACSFAMASGTGLFDPTRLDWSNGVLERCGIGPAKLNPLSDDPVLMTAAFARRFPNLRNALWFPAIGDGAASNLGSGATEPGQAAINFGTSGAVRVMHRGQKARAPIGLFCYRVDDERYLVGGAISNAGNLRQWCLRELKLPDDATIERELAKRPGPGHGLTVLPSWVSERAPTWREDLRGAIVGLTQATTALDILQATREATFHQLARIIELIPKQKSGALQIIVSGGLQQSRTDLQRLADVLGQPVFGAAEPEASLRGAAVFVLGRLGVTVSPPAIGRRFRPRPVFARQYALARKLQIALEQASINH